MKRKSQKAYELHKCIHTVFHLQGSDKDFN